MAPVLPVDVYGGKYDELQVATFFVRKTHHLKTKTKTLQRLGEFSVKSATRNQQAILPTAIACRCPSDKKIRRGGRIRR